MSEQNEREKEIIFSPFIFFSRGEFEKAENMRFHRFNQRKWILRQRTSRQNDDQNISKSTFLKKEMHHNDEVHFPLPHLHSSQRQTNKSGQFPRERDDLLYLPYRTKTERNPKGLVPRYTQKKCA